MGFTIGSQLALETKIQITDNKPVFEYLYSLLQ